MLEYLKKEANKTRTENGAATYLTTQSDCLDLFACIGALRSATDGEVIDRFVRAYAEDPDLTMKTLFYARDVRGGLGERKVFRTILRYLAKEQQESVRKNISYIAEYGRWDDLLVLFGTTCEDAAMDLIRKQLDADAAALENGGEVSLLAKWLPSVNATNEVTVSRAKKIAKALGINDAAYRKKLVALRAHIRLIENNLREKDYSFDYAKQPSKAMFKYRKAFIRNDGDRYQEFLAKVDAGEATMHTGSLAPYEIVAPFFSTKVSAEDQKAIDATWRAQEDFIRGENALVVIDGSGSMYGGGQPLPAAVAMSLGIYFAERNTGAFHNHFITFSTKPQLVEVKGQDILEKLKYCSSFNEVADTNVLRVFELILNAAVKNKVPQSELPSTLYFITDMEFNYCACDADMTNFEYARQLFEAHGYTLPRVVVWNVQSRNRQQPVTQNEQGVALVSGCTPRIFSMLADGELSPYAYMLRILSSERYEPIAA